MKLIHKNPVRKKYLLFLKIKFYLACYELTFIFNLLLDIYFKTVKLICLIEELINIVYFNALK